MRYRNFKGKTKLLLTCLFLLVWLLVAMLFLYQPRMSFDPNTQKSLNKFRESLPQIQSDLADQLRENDRLLSVLSGVTAPTKPSDTNTPVIGILIIACDRVSVSRHLDQLLSLRRQLLSSTTRWRSEQLPVVVSQDCGGHKPTAAVIDSYGQQLRQHIYQPDNSSYQLPAKQQRFAGYYRISRHYRWALGEMFERLGYEQVIVLEDDLDLAPDLLEYFIGLLPLLQLDQSIWCVSAWNDNGKESLVDTNRPELLYRSDFFPGLGWMLTKRVWQELRDKWPKSFWDDWIRMPEQRLGRQCIRPEVSRTRTFGKIGVSKGMFYEKHLKFIHLNQKPVMFSRENLTYLISSRYQSEFSRSVFSCRAVSVSDWRNQRWSARTPCLRLTYTNCADFKRLARMLGLMDDFKSGVPRTSYRGIVSAFSRGIRVYLAPPANSWHGYDPTCE